mgnify:CR=1 FL=1
MRVLVVGGGGREHALAWKIAQSPLVKKVYCAPGNAGTASVAENIEIQADNVNALLQFATVTGIGLTVVGPEQPLVKGIVDSFEESGLRVFGPSQRAAEIEGSKVFCKDLMKKYGIPTGRYESFDSPDQVKLFTKEDEPVVVKASGLAAGKGVILCSNGEEARSAVQSIMQEKAFGSAGNQVVIEEFLTGQEVSLLAFTDGKTVLPLDSAQDHKAAFDGDKGPNTGGMGAISPVPFADDTFMHKIEERIVKPTIIGLQKDNLPYKGFVFIGLIKVGNDPKVIEYNVRMGDPETEVVLPRLKNDLVEIFQAISNQTLDKIKIEIDQRAATTVMLVSGGYPEAYEKGKEIKGIDSIKDSIPFHAGAVLKDGKVITSGGRVMAITSYGNTYQEAIKKSYQNIEKLHFDKMNYRKDIGFDL